MKNILFVICALLHFFSGKIEAMSTDNKKSLSSRKLQKLAVKDDREELAAEQLLRLKHSNKVAAKTSRKKFLSSLKEVLYLRQKKIPVQNLIEKKMYELFVLQKRVEGINFENIILQKQIDKRNYDILALQKKIVYKNSGIPTLQRQMDRKNSEISELFEQLTDRKRYKLPMLEDQIDRKHHELFMLNEQLNELNIWKTHAEEDKIYSYMLLQKAKDLKHQL